MNLTATKAFIIKNVGILFIVVFDALIFTTAFLLIQDPPARAKGSPFAELVSISAYCSLAVGIILMAWDFAKKKTLGGRSI